MLRAWCVDCMTLAIVSKVRRAREPGWLLCTDSQPVTTCWHSIKESISRRVVSSSVSLFLKDDFFFSPQHSVPLICFWLLWGFCLSTYQSNVFASIYASVIHPLLHSISLLSYMCRFDTLFRHLEQKKKINLFLAFFFLIWPCLFNLLNVEFCTVAFVFYISSACWKENCLVL